MNSIKAPKVKTLKQKKVKISKSACTNCGFEPVKLMKAPKVSAVCKICNLENIPIEELKAHTESKSHLNKKELIKMIPKMNDEEVKTLLADDLDEKPEEEKNE